MDYFWTDEADMQYKRYATDPAVQQTFRDLVLLIDDAGPDAGWKVADIVNHMDDPIARRIGKAIAGNALPGPARIVVATIIRKAKPYPPPWLAAVVHLRGAPTTSNASHTILTMGTVARNRGASLQ
jgi:hypothetical protein